MMKKGIYFVETQSAFDQLIDQLSNAQWFAFDTEFIGEKTYIPQLCLIQVLHDTEVYLIDTVTLKDMQPFADLIGNPNILKITHAGDNDYRLMYQLYGVVPSNIFDTQIAAGFIGYSYPTGFGRIVGTELNIELGKGYAVTQWDKRPLDEKVLEYAVEDVIFLRKLFTNMTAKLQKHQRESWVYEELSKWEQKSFYETHPLRDLLSTDIIYRLRSEKEKVFLYRIYDWRKQRAETENIPKEHALPAKYISTIVKSMKDGKRSLQNNRTLPDHYWQKHYDIWAKMYETAITDDDRKIIKSIPPEAEENQEKDWLLDLIYHLVKKRGVDSGVSAALLLSRTDFNRIKSGVYEDGLLGGWRGELLGPELVHWLEKQGKINVTWEDHACILRMK
jgi:ribonuclease D